MTDRPVSEAAFRAVSDGAKFYIISEVDEVAVMRAQIAELESRLATAEAAHHGLEASSLVGAGGFEPSFAGFSYVEHPSGPSLVRDLVDEARGAAEAGPDVPVRARVA